MKGNRGRQKEMNEGAKRTKGEDRIERRGEKEQICFKCKKQGGGCLGRKWRCKEVRRGRMTTGWVRKRGNKRRKH